MALGENNLWVDFSGPPCGRERMIRIAIRKVNESIQRAVSIPYLEIVNPPIPAPIPMAADQPPEESAFADNSSSLVQIFGT